MAEPLVRFTVINETPGEVQLLWINDETREEVSYTNIRAGQRATQQTFPGHEWHCRTVDGGVTLVECKVHTDLSICIGQPVASSRAPAEAEAASASTTDGFYHHCVRIASIPVRAHVCVSVEAVQAAADVIGGMLRDTPADVLVRMRAAGCTVAVIGRAQLTSDVPEHRFLSAANKGDWTYDATTRGVGGSPAVPVSSVGEENLLEDEPELPVDRPEVASAAVSMAIEDAPMDDADGATGAAAPALLAGAADESKAPAGASADKSSLDTCQCVICGAPAPSPSAQLRRRRRRDQYPLESILVHEFAHCVMDVGLDDAARARIRAAHADALRRGLIDAESYMGSNSSEYWAESAQAWFEASVRCDVNCGLNTRAELRRRDPAVAEELRNAFGDGEWRYTMALRQWAPTRAARWAELAAKRERVRATSAYQWMVPLCECVRKNRPPSVAAASGQWREGQPVCSGCAAVLREVEESRKAGRAHGRAE
jgi:hypothetical protein